MVDPKRRGINEGFGKQKAEDRRQKAEDRSQKSEIRNQNTELRTVNGERFFDDRMAHCWSISWRASAPSAP